MNILVLGGSYFLGKHFVELARQEHTLTVFNRGTRPFPQGEVRQFLGDRRDEKALSALEGEHFDAVVDFCGYEAQDIARVFRALKGGFGQYLFLSTCDVYPHGTGECLNEDSPFEEKRYAGEEGAYIAGKTALERELAWWSGERGIPYTCFRPAFIYGEGNYAPREGMYFHWIREAGQILHPVDATGVFQLVYVKDVARAVLAALGNPKAYGRSYNLAPLPGITYESFADALQQAAGRDFVRVPITLQTIAEKRIPLPFPLMEEESNTYEGKRVLELIGSYTPLEEGLAQTWRETFGD